MNKTVRRVILSVCAMAAATVLILAAAGNFLLQQERMAGQPVVRPVIVVDPGHGGMDGGAQAPDGTLEKHINLCIALPLGDMLRLLGYEVRLTRTVDESIHDASCQTAREKKVSDMKNRLVMYEQSALTVSIHQNKFGVAKYHGAQVFYSTNNSASEPLAAAVRGSVYSLLQPDNTRMLKRGNKDIFLLYKTTAPAILVECGFLSNPQELAQLKDSTYQNRIAFAVAAGVAEYWAGA